MRNPFRRKNLDGRFLLPWVASVALLVCSEPGPRSIAIGAPFVVAGLAIRGWAVGHLVKTVRFTVTGPYAYLRHPLYLGTLSVALGIALMLGGWPASVGVAAIGLWFAWSYMPRKERVETERLLGLHGDVYARYRREVPALVPRLHPWRPAAELAGRVDTAGAWRIERFDANNEQGTVIAVAVAVSAVVLRAALA